AAKATVQREETHHVVGGQGGGVQLIDVGAVLVVEAAAAQRRAEEVLVEHLGATRSVLVVLQLGQSYLDAPRQARQREGLRVGLLEVIDAAQAQVFGDLVAVGVLLDELRQSAVRALRDQVFDLLDD